MSLRDYGIVCDEEPDYTHEQQQIIVEFRTRFKIVKEMGYVKSHRSNNTGIGKTFEDLMEIPENNIADVDFMDFIEVKSKRAASESMLTLFTKSPDYPPKCNTYLRDTFGQIDERSGLKELHTTISSKKYNTYGGNIGFKLELDEINEKLYILVKDLKTEKNFETEIYYTFETLKSKSKKYGNIAFIWADTEKRADGHEYFKYTRSQLLAGLTFEKFLKGIKDGKIFYDIRIGSYKSGKNIGKPHDHGSGFRVKKNDIPSLFTVIDF